MHDYRLHAHAVAQRWRWRHFLNGTEINTEYTKVEEVGGCVCLCRNGGLFRVGGLLPANCVFPALCLPINWPCGLSPAGQAATERSQVLWEYSTAFCMRCLKSRISIFLFIYLFPAGFHMFSFSFVTAATVKNSSHSVWASALLNFTAMMLTPPTFQ